MDRPNTLPALGADQLASAYGMVDVGGKEVTLRRAWAEGYLCMRPETLVRVRDRDLPKGDCFGLAEAAGIFAAKRTSELIPLCHHLPLEKIAIECQVVEEQQAVRIASCVSTHSKTGVEMEALVAVQIALLTVYDLVKQVDPELTVQGVKLLRKEGGKSGLWVHPIPAVEIQ